MIWNSRDGGSGTGSGQGLAEYVLILALIAMVAITAILFFGGGIDRILSATSTATH